ncbi:MAG TPA: PDZ domain-containing protein, partial [Geobacteraceae bacterium]|nr:PDZ domain-containing protein [Geobacteraceae bacterium]
PTSYLLIGGKEIRIPKEKEVRMMNVSLPSLPMPPYDFIAYIDYEDLPKSGFRLGVMIEPAGKGRGLIVRDIVPGSYAERAGIKKNDLLLTLDGISLEDNLDLIYSLKQKRPGDHLNLKVEREGKPMIVEFLIPPTEEKTLEEKK